MHGSSLLIRSAGLRATDGWRRGGRVDGRAVLGSPAAPASTGARAGAGGSAAVRAGRSFSASVAQIRIPADARLHANTHTRIHKHTRTQTTHASTRERTRPRTRTRKAGRTNARARAQKTNQPSVLDRTMARGSRPNMIGSRSKRWPESTRRRARTRPSYACRGGCEARATGIEPHATLTQ